MEGAEFSGLGCRRHLQAGCLNGFLLLPRLRKIRINEATSLGHGWDGRNLGHSEGLGERTPGCRLSQD